MRKMHFLGRARALVAFPGGWGTFDELFEALTLIQTKKMAPIPVILYCKEWWSRLVNFDHMVEEGVISEEDMELFSYAESPQQGWYHGLMLLVEVQNAYGGFMQLGIKYPRSTNPICLMLNRRTINQRSASRCNKWERRIHWILLLLILINTVTMTSFSYTPTNETFISCNEEDVQHINNELYTKSSSIVPAILRKLFYGE